MILGIITLLTALSISAVAIYYSVAGLVAIFAAAAVPIIIMGSVLEIAKLVTAIWLHYYWDRAVWWLKAYLVTAVVILMFITSMGIFGFLSKAHIDQTAKATEGLARLEQLDAQIERQNDIVARAQQEIAQLETSGTDSDTRIQSQISIEEDRIESAYARIQPAIDEQNAIIAKEEDRLGASVNLYKDLIVTIDRNLQSIKDNLASGNVEAVQALVGVEADGDLGPATERAIEAFIAGQTAERNRLTDLIAVESKNITSLVIDAARAEIQRLRGIAEQEIAKSNELINRLRQQLGTVDIEQIDTEITQLRNTISKAETEIEKFNEQKFGLEAEYRKLEAEVGPIKYLAEFVYGNAADSDLLEEAVRWVIILIIFVFDPLAVLLLIASQQTFLYYREKKSLEVKQNDVSDRLDIQQSDKKTRTGTQTSATKKRRKEKNASNDSGTVEINTAVPGTGPENGGLTDDRLSTETNIDTDASMGDIRSEDVDFVTITSSSKLEPNQVQLDEDRQRRIVVLNEIESKDEVKLAKIQWKKDNPDLTIKEFKEAYINGEIEQLPWEGYVQNSEQNENSIWKNIKRNE